MVQKENIFHNIINNDDIKMVDDDDDDDDDYDNNDEKNSILNDYHHQNKITTNVNKMNNNIIKNDNKEMKTLESSTFTSPQLSSSSSSSSILSPSNLQQQQQQQQQNNVVDRYNFVYIVLLLHGIAMLMPWNMFINATEYFTDYKLTIKYDNGTILESKYKEYFLSNLGIASQIPNVLFNILNIFFQFGKNNNDSFTIRIMIAIIIEFILIIITVILALINTDSIMTIFFYLTMLTVIIINMVNAIYQNSFYGIGSCLPMRYTNAIITGTNICGTFTSIMNIITIALSPNKRIAAVYFFSSAIIILLLAFISFILLKKNEYFQYYYLQNARQQPQQQQNDIEMKTTTTTTTENQNLLNQSTPATPTITNDNENLFVFKYVWKQCLNVFLVFFVTLSTFPVIQSSIRPIEQDIFGTKELTDKYFVSIFCFLIFNLFALIGNLIPNLVIFPRPNRLWIPITIRFLFIPFFLLCNYSPEKRRWPVLIQSDYLYLFGSILMAFSSGYYSSLSMMYASISVPDKKYSTKAGMMAAASLICGIFLGVNFSSLLAWLIKL